MNSEKVLILGVTGMLGSMLYKCFTTYSEFETFGVARDASLRVKFLFNQSDNLVFSSNITDPCEVRTLLRRIKPTVIINCIGVVKQLSDSANPLVALPVNALFPHQLHAACAEFGCRLIHFSTDCVFSGAAGPYDEQQIPDARDLYGLSKYIGEISSVNCVTLRTSIVGHELFRHSSLLDWFLTQEGRVNGYRNSIFSGLSTREIFDVLTNYILPDRALSGLFHLSSDPISKLDLLRAVAVEYKKVIEIVPCEAPKLDRSLVSSRFRNATGYVPRGWGEQLEQLRLASIQLGGYRV